MLSLAIAALWSNNFIANFKDDLSCSYRLFITGFKQLLTNNFKLEATHIEANLRPCRIHLKELFAKMIYG